MFQNRLTVNFLCPFREKRRLEMEDEMLKKPSFVEKIVSIIGSGLSRDDLIERLQDYHVNDIAQSLELLNREE
jgi:magnesium transporter